MATLTTAQYIVRMGNIGAMTLQGIAEPNPLLVQNMGNISYLVVLGGGPPPQADEPEAEKAPEAATC